ncbi:MAG: hypothetical protein GY800_00465 [Planctomycetes bacterium]|nr:hypothetical protein [Planctomycetota bacterium]
MSRVVDRRKAMDEILIGLSYEEGGQLAEILKKSQVERQLVLSILPELEAILLDNEMRGKR